MTVFWIIVAGAVLTYLTRAGGYLLVSRFGRLHPRAEAALDAVPAAVLTTLVAPTFATHAGPAEFAALAVAGLVALRSSLLMMFLAGAAVLAVARAVGF